VWQLWKEEEESGSDLRGFVLTGLGFELGFALAKLEPHLQSRRMVLDWN
jgi:hypothetical protein